jgi:hypothetical protein
MGKYTIFPPYLRYYLPVVFCEQVRTKLFGASEATYSGYTCYTGVADFVPPDIESVG